VTLADDAKALAIIEEDIDAHNISKLAHNIRRFNAATASFQMPIIPEDYVMRHAAVGDLKPLTELLRKGNASPQQQAFAADLLDPPKRGRGNRTQPMFLRRRNSPVVRAALEVPVLEAILREKFPQRFPGGRGYKIWAMRLAAKRHKLDDDGAAIFNWLRRNKPRKK
jgi:hypothetical protein